MAEKLDIQEQLAYIGSAVANQIIANRNLRGKRKVDPETLASGMIELIFGDRQKRIIEADMNDPHSMLVGRALQLGYLFVTERDKQTDT